MVATDETLALKPWRAHTQLETIWTELASDPQQQALVCAEFCCQHAPHLIEWLKAKIYAALPDALLAQLVFEQPEDGRIQALGRLSGFREQQPLPVSPPRHEPVRTEAKPFKVARDYLPDLSRIRIIPDLIGELRIDAELGRGCVALHKAGEYRFYVIAREVTRSRGGSGKITRHDLKEALEVYNIGYSARHFNRIIKAGHHLFWRVDGDQIYLVHPGKLAARLVALSPQTFVSNRPGGRDMYLSPVGSLEQWEAGLYAAWMAYHNNPTISRAALEQLFGRDQNSLRRWEDTRLYTILDTRANYCQCPDYNDEFFDYVPDHAQAYLANVYFQGRTEQAIRMVWRIPNTYQVTGIRQHPRKGQGRKVRRYVNEALARPADQERGGDTLRKRYFDNARHLKTYIDKHDGVGYLWRGENRRRQGMWEINRSGFWQTHSHERASRKAERLYFAQQWTRSRIWLERQGGGD